MSADTGIRDRIRAGIILTMEEAQAQGLDPLSVAEATYPDVPSTVLFECWCDVGLAAEEAWWHAMENVIEAEVVNKAAALLTPPASDAADNGHSRSSTEAVR